MNRSRHTLLRAALATAILLPARGATSNWDTNGDTAGSGNAGGTWDSGTNWSPNADGGSTTGWTNGDSAVFSAGTDGTAAVTVTLGGTVATPSITLEEAGLVTLSGGTIDITGGSLFNTSALGGVTGRTLNWNPILSGDGALNLAAHGDTSASGGSSSSYFQLSGPNTFTGNVTITSGVVHAGSNFGNAANKIVLNGGGLLDPNLNIALARDIEIGAAGGVIRAYGSVSNFRMQGALTGSGELRRTDGGTAILTGNGTGFTGALNVQRGTMQIGDGTQTTNLLANTSGIVLGDAGGAGTVRYQLASSFTLGTPVSFGNAGSTFIWQGTNAADTLTIASAIGTNSATGILRVNSGAVTLGSGADVRVASVGLFSTPANNAAGLIGTLNIGEGASLTTRYIGLGDGSNASGIINQTGGTVTIEAGGNGIRIGHWANGSSPGSVYNLSGGTLDASAISAVNIGWDGRGDMVVGGGTGAALLKATTVQVDASGNTTPDMRLTVSTNGTVEASANIASASAGDTVVLNGGTLRGTGSGTWSAPLVTNAATTSRLENTAGVTTILSGPISGSGNLIQGGSGTIAYTGASTGFTGNLTVNSGTMSGTGTIAGNVTINSAINAGATSASGVTGTLTLGDAGAPTTNTTLNGTAIFDLNAASTSSGNDLIAVQDNLTFGASALVRPVFYGGNAASGASYNLFSYTGGLSGTPELDTAYTSGFRQTFALDSTSSGLVKLNVSGSAASLIWTGGAGNLWDINASAYWDNAGSPDKFYQTDSVSFTDAGDSSSPVQVVAPLQVGGMTINSGEDYTFTGASILGGATLEKSGAGSATFLNDIVAGVVNINAGSITFGNGGTTGSLSGTGTIHLAEGASLTFDRSNAVNLNRAFTATSAGTLIKEGTGNLTASPFQLLPTNVLVNEGTLTFSGGGFGGNRLVGNGSLTINSGATAVLAAGSAHALGGTNTTMTEAVVINGGTLTVNQEQYLSNLTLSGGTINGTSEIRATNTTNWQVVGTAASTVSSNLALVGNASWQVSDVTGNPSADLLLTGQVTGGGAMSVSGAGTVGASGNNNFTGGLSISGATYQTGSATALGFGGAIGNSAVAGTTVTGGGAIDLRGQTVNEVISLDGGRLLNQDTTNAATLQSGIAGVRVTAAGTGYTSAPTLAFTGGGGTGATATAGLSTTTLGSITTTAAGSGYSSAPTVAVTGGGGTGATATAVISSLQLTGTANQLGGAGTLNVNSIITGTGGFTKVGTGTLNLGRAASSFSGDILVDAGAINLAVQGNATTSALGSQSSSRTVTINQGGTVNFNTNNILGNGATAVTSLPTFVVGQGGTLATNNYNVIGAVTLQGGTMIVARTGTPGSYQGFEFKGTITSGGSAQSTIAGTEGFGHHMAGAITFNVGDAVTGTDLAVNAALRNGSPDVSGLTGSLVKTGTGTMAMNATNTYSGTTTVSAGTLLVNGALGSGSVTVDVGAILGGGGATAGLIGGSVTVNGTFAPGNEGPGGIGTLGLGSSLTLGSGSALLWDLDPASPLSLGIGLNDFATVGGDLLLDGTLSVVGTGSFAGIGSGTRWTLLTYSGSLSGSGLDLGTLPSLDAGLSWEVDTGISGEVGLVIVPEPRTALLGTLGSLLLFRRRASRK